MKSPVFLCLISLSLAACGPTAEPPSAPPAETAPAAVAIAISDAWARPTPGGVDVGAGYLTITNNGADDQLLAASSPRAGRVEVHTMSMDGGMMQMRPAGVLALAHGQTLTLAPGGLHLMFFALPAPLALGEEIPVTLTFAEAGPVETTLVVQRDPPEAAHGH
jgi:copper(I)-binding protein